MLVPHVVVVVFQLLVGGKGPMVFFRDEFYHTFINRECGHADFRAHPVAVVRTIRIGRCVECEVAA